MPQNNDNEALANIEAKIDEITSCVASLKQAFPDGDIVGHRKYHEARIKAAVAEEEFWKDLKLDIAKKGAWGLIVIVIGLILIGISVKIGAIAKV